MGIHQSSVCWHRNKHIIISLLFLSVSSFIHITSMAAAEGRSIPKPPLETITKVEEPGGVEKVEKIRSQMGSRPPSCIRRCRNCGGHCEAVQVPVAQIHETQNQRRRRRRSSRHFYGAEARAAGENETSNYKPMSWKCKCGNFIFDP